jgi:hypothetical protein
LNAPEQFMSTQQPSRFRNQRPAGKKRAMEIAQSFHGFLVMLIRRGKNRDKRAGIDQHSLHLDFPNPSK